MLSIRGLVFFESRGGWPGRQVDEVDFGFWDRVLLAVMVGWGAAVVAHAALAHVSRGADE
jgi:hypothetical protein